LNIPKIIIRICFIYIIQSFDYLLLQDEPLQLPPGFPLPSIIGRGLITKEIKMTKVKNTIGPLFFIYIHNTQYTIHNTNTRTPV